MAAKSLEAKVIEARAKLAALRGDERADLPSGPERTAYNKELRRITLDAKKLEALFASPDYAPAEKRALSQAPRTLGKALPDITLTGTLARIEEITYRQKDGTRAPEPMSPVAWGPGKQRPTDRPIPAVKQVVVGHGRRKKKVVIQNHEAIKQTMAQVKTLNERVEWKRFREATISENHRLQYIHAQERAAILEKRGFPELAQRLAKTHRFSDARKAIEALL